MKNVVILGQSFGVYELAKTLAQTEKDIKVSVVSLDGQLPHDQDLLADYLAKKISKDQLISADKDFYKKNKIEVILDQKLDRMSLRQKKLTMESKEHMKFDALVIAGTPEYRWPDIKGVQKQGVYHVRSLGAVDQIVQQLPFIKSVVIQIYDWNDVKVALGLKAWGKEVTVIIPHDTRMARMLEHDVCEKILSSFQEESWSVYYGQSITEILGDSETKAVRLSSGKVFAADMAILGQVEPRMRILDGVMEEDASAVEVQADFQSKAECVYAFGDISQRVQDKAAYWSMKTADWKIQAEQLAGVICESANVGATHELPLQASAVSYAIDFENYSLKVLGDITPASNMVTFRSWNAETNVYQKIFTINGKVKGAIVMNVAHSEAYEHLITEQIVVAGCEKHVFDAALSWDQLKEILTHPPQEQVNEEGEGLSHSEGEHQVAEGMQQNA